MHLAVEPTATAYVLFILHKSRNVYRLHPVFVCERRVEDMFRPTQSSMTSCLARLRCCGSRWHGSGTQEPCGCQCQQASRMDPGLLLEAAAAAAAPRSALRSDPAQKKQRQQPHANCFCEAIADMLLVRLTCRCLRMLLRIHEHAWPA